MKRHECAACGSTENLHYHHLIPRSLGGSDDETNLITLCGECHAKAHGIRANWHTSTLTRAGLKRAKARGVELGNRVNLGEARAKGCAVIRAKADQDAARLADVLIPMRAAGASLRAMASRLEALGIPTARGGQWQARQVARILDRLDA